MANYPAGVVTAYGAAVRGGYTGTYAEFCQQQANFAVNAQAVETNKNLTNQYAQNAADSATASSQSAAESKEARDEAVNAKDELIEVIGAVAIELGAVLMDQNGDFYVLEETEDE